MNATLREQLKDLRLSGLSQSLEVRLQEEKASKHGPCRVRGPLCSFRSGSDCAPAAQRTYLPRPS